MKSPHAHLAPLPQGKSIWTGGFWADRFNTCKDSVIPNIYRLFADDALSHCIANFRIAAGEERGEHQGPPFADGDFYKWIEGASWVYGISGGVELKRAIDAAAGYVLRAQREDGYIFTREAIRTRNGGSGGALTDSLNFEVYNLGHLITAGCVHYRATGEKTLLDAGIRAADYLGRIFGENLRGKAKTAICPSHYMALIELYRTTGEARHLETARRAIALRDEIQDGTDDNQDRLPLGEHRQILGHAVRATYLYAGVADLYAETGDPALLPPLESLIADEISSKIYINGGIGALYDGVSPSGHAGDFPSLQRTHQAFGRPYELPNITAYNETCASVGNILWNWRLFLIKPQTRYIDLIEHSFYNLILASVSLDGKKYFYTNMLRREKDKLPYFLKWSGTREPWLSSFCCPPNMMRILAESAGFAYGVNQDSIYTGLYGEGSAEIDLGGGRSCRLTQKTAYPWDGKILIRFDDARALSCTLYVRVPFWAEGGIIRDPGGNRRVLGPSDAGTFIPLERIWHSGDEVAIDFPVEPALYLGHPLIEETNHHAAVMRGPLLYCMEGCDNPGPAGGLAHGPATLGLRRDAVFREVNMNVAGTDLVALETDDGASYPPPDWGNGKIYQKAGRGPAAREKVRLIPYFAWDNRGPAAMKVWLPLYL
ncbi:MAG: glycoside hydrolase family 127 protein [Treponema sp.]|jgi:DUF1680 family protein|nr:glycoside hydrolase family 127 protein [Treponema sp.]